MFFNFLIPFISTVVAGGLLLRREDVSAGSWADARGLLFGCFVFLGRQAVNYTVRNRGKCPYMLLVYAVTS